MGTTRERIVTRLDWINVPYRTVYLAGGGVFVALVLLVLGLVYRETILDVVSPARREARTEIGEASKLLGEAASYARDGATAELHRNAQGKLDEAQGEYGQRNYRDARTAAIVSQNYSQKVIDIGRGDSEANREVRFYRLEGEVRVKRSGQFHWETASPRMQLRIGDQIKTGANSGAQILYFDGTITTVRAESLLEIKDLYEEPISRQRRVSEKLNWGEIETATRKANVSGSYHEVQSEVVSAKSREDAEFKVAYDMKQEAGNVSLFTGKIDVATSQAVVTMKGGEGVSIDKGVLGAVEKLPPAPRPLVPSDQRIFVYAAPGDASTTLGWEPVPDATTYHLQLSQRSLFSALLVDKRDVRTSAVELPGLPADGYYWRVATIDSVGRVSRFSSVRKFKISTRALREGSDRVPPPLAVQDFITNGPYVILNGKTEAGATVWVEGERIDVDDDGVFYAVVRLKREGANQVQLVAQDPAGNEARKSMEAYVESY